MRAQVFALLAALAVSPQSLAQSAIENIYIARSFRESRTEPTSYCDATRTGFAGTTMEDRYTFRAVATQTSDGSVTDADAGVIGALHACFGPPVEDPASLNFFSEGNLGDVTFTGRGNCLSTRTDYPEPGINGFRCYLDLTDLPAEYAGGTLTTNTIGSRNVAGGVTDPPGYVQASIATVRLWRRRAAANAQSPVAPSGAAAYARHCASCHEQVDARIPTRDALAQMSPARILRTLDFGLMMSIAYPMTARRARGRRCVSRYGARRSRRRRALAARQTRASCPARRKPAGPAGARRKTTRAFNRRNAQACAPPTSRVSS